jgi:hypothetical protein
LITVLRMKSLLVSAHFSFFMESSFYSFLMLFWDLLQSQPDVGQTLIGVGPVHILFGMLLADAEEDFLARGKGIALLCCHGHGIAAAGVLRGGKPSFGDKVVLFIAEDMVQVGLDEFYVYRDGDGLGVILLDVNELWRDGRASRYLEILHGIL